MIAYLDSSIFARRYLPEAGAASVRALFRSQRSIAASRLAFVEVCAALCRACREDVIGVEQRDEVITRLPKDFGNLKLVVEPGRDIYARANRLLAIHPLRAFDALQLASALEVRGRVAATELWTADGRLVAAARAEGLKAVVP